MNEVVSVYVDDKDRASKQCHGHKEELCRSNANMNKYEESIRGKLTLSFLILQIGYPIHYRIIVLSLNDETETIEIDFEKRPAPFFLILMPFLCRNLVACYKIKWLKRAAKAP